MLDLFRIWTIFYFSFEYDMQINHTKKTKKQKRKYDKNQLS